MLIRNEELGIKDYANMPYGICIIVGYGVLDVPKRNN